MRKILIILASGLLFACNVDIDPSTSARFKDSEKLILNGRSYSLVEEQGHKYICYGETIIHGLHCECNNNVITDLPKEYSLISTNSNKPDTMIAFYKNDKLCLRFLTAARNYPKENH